MIDDQEAGPNIDWTQSTNTEMKQRVERERNQQVDEGPKVEAAILEPNPETEDGPV